MTNTKTSINNIEENLLFHWETIINCDESTKNCCHYDQWHDESMNQIRIEMDLFLEHILPDFPEYDWGFWSDGTVFYTKSEELAERLWKIISFFADAHMFKVDPTADELYENFEDYYGQTSAYWNFYWA